MSGRGWGAPRDRLERWRARCVRFLFERLYHQLAWSYDWVSETFWQGRWRIWQRAALTGIQAGPVLELGFGTGDLLADLAQRGWWAAGVDASPQMARLARRKLGARGLRLPLVQAQAQSLPFAAEAFGAVVATFPSDYIADPCSLQEIRRVLAPGGRLIVVESAWARPTGAAGPALRLVHRLVYGTTPDLRHLPIPAEAAGFEVRRGTVETPAGPALVLLACKPEPPA